MISQKCLDIMIKKGIATIEGVYLGWRLDTQSENLGFPVLNWEADSIGESVEFYDGSILASCSQHGVDYIGVVS